MNAWWSCLPEVVFTMVAKVGAVAGDLQITLASMDMLLTTLQQA